jgi:putative membrane protein
MTPAAQCDHEHAHDGGQRTGNRGPSRRGLATWTVQVFVLALWLVALLWLLEQGRYQRFIAPLFGGLLAGAGGLLLLFLLATVWHDRSLTQCAPPLGRWARAAVLLLPLVYLSVAPAGGLGSAAFAGRSTGAGRPTAIRRLPPHPEADGTVELLDLLTNFDHYAGQRVHVVGIVYRGAGVPPGHIVLFRFVLTCCAADALPAAVLVECARPDDWAADTWVRATGVPRLTELDGQAAPSLGRAELAPCAAPANPYLGAW